MRINLNNIKPEEYSAEELHSLVSRILPALPPHLLQTFAERILAALPRDNIDLEKELVAHFRLLKRLAQDEEDVKACTALTTLMKQLADTQEKIYNIERVKILERTLIQCLPEDVRVDFLEKYQAELEKVAK